MGVVVKTILVTSGCLIAAIIAGIVGCSIVDILPLRFAAILLFYGIWLVAGVFCGLLAFDYAGSWATPKAEPTARNVADDWSGLPEAKRTGNIIFTTATLLVLAICAALYPYIWEGGGSGDAYDVPGSFSHSIVFFLAVLGGLYVARFHAMPDREGPVT